MVRFFEIVEFYLDQNNITNNPYSNDAITKIGCRSSTSDYAFNGLIDDVMLFDRALSGDEIQTLFNCGNLSYDAAGNLTQDQRGYEYDAYGNPYILDTQYAQQAAVGGFSYSFNECSPVNYRLICFSVFL